MEADRKQKRCARSITIARAVSFFILLHRQRGDTLNDDEKKLLAEARKRMEEGRRGRTALHVRRRLPLSPTNTRHPGLNETPLSATTRPPSP
jgi:hypothetical protein